MNRAHALGREVIPWTIDIPEAVREQLAAEVDGIITSYPTCYAAYCPSS
ncbi:glycerophosphodiester phosphodiesterase family protein [Mycobacterium asiaticum]|nr:glycerophosphodiester phosphodiesterase family protein [Mycobacterium asiaticum]